MKHALVCILKYNFISLNSLHSIKINIRKNALTIMMKNILNCVTARLILAMLENI
jgi:hypothetical protein